MYGNYKERKNSLNYLENYFKFYANPKCNIFVDFV